MSDQESTHQKELPNNLDLIAFHLPILLLGGLAVMPIIYYVLSTLGFLGEDLSELISSYSYEKLVILSIASLLPSMLAYGRNLKFSFWRFLIGIAIVVYFGLKSYAQLKASVSLPLPIGGGLIGVIIASALGWAGFLARKKFSRRQAGWGALFVVVISIVIFTVYVTTNNYLANRVWDIQTAIKWADTWDRYFVSMGEAKILGTGVVVDVIPINDGVDQNLIVQLEGNKTIYVDKRSSRHVVRSKGKTEEIVDYPECRFSPVKVGDRVRFEGRYMTPDYVLRYDVKPNVDISSEVGLVDVEPCYYNKKPKNFGSLNKID